MTMSAFGAQAARSEITTTHDARRTWFLLAKLGDATNGVERGDRIGARGWLGRRLAEPVANIEQHLEEQLFTLVGGVEVGHPALVSQLLRAIVGFAVHR